MRIFIAIEIATEIKKQIGHRIDFLKGQAPNLRVNWEQFEKLHLTLKFLGEVSENDLSRVIGAAQAAVRTVSPFQLKIERPGFFPVRGRPARVLWFGIKDDSRELQKLQRQLENECEKIGFAPEKRPFSPHLTVARLREPEKSSDLVNLHQNTLFETDCFAVDHITVFQSQLTQAGSHYRALKQINLNAP